MRAEAPAKSHGCLPSSSRSLLAHHLSWRVARSQPARVGCRPSPFSTETTLGARTSS